MLNITGFRLSPLQKHLWLLQRGAGATPYRVQCSVLIEGAADAALLRAALRDVVARHEILRTVFQFVPGASLPLQVVTEDPDFSCSLHDLTGAGPAEQRAEIDAFYGELWRRPFDHAGGPTLHAAIVSCSASRHVLIVGLPAVCMDSSGLVSLAREIGRACAAHLGGREGTAETAEEPMQYADLAQWQNEMLEEEEASAGSDYWREAARAAAAEVSASAGDELRPRTLALDVPERLRSGLAALSGALDVPPALLVFSCWQLLLWRLTGADPVVVGATFDGRSYEGLEGALGLFARSLPLSASLDGAMSFRESVRRNERLWREAREWQEYFSWEQAQGPAPSSAAPPYCRYGFEEVEAPDDWDEGGLRFRVERLESCTDRHDVRLSCTAGGDSLRLDYDAGALDQAEAARMGERLLTLLSSALDGPGREIGRLEVVGDGERRLLVAGFNDTARDYPPDDCLHRLFEQQAERTPAAVAVIYEGERLTYAELNDRANQLARRLRALGVGPDSLVGVLMERSVEMVVSLLATLKAGGAYVPLDASYPAERVRFMLEDSGARVVLTQGHLRAVAPAAGADAGAASGVEVVCVDEEWAEIASAHASGNLEGGARPENLAYVIYTSGSTGRPKGVMISHAAICNHMRWMQEQYPLAESDAVAQKTPFSFDASVWEFWAPLLAGARLVVARPGGHQDGAYLARLMAEQRVTTLQLVPSMLAVMLEEKGLSECRELRRVFCGGEALRRELREKFFARLDAELVNLYGPTEATIDATFWACARGESGDVPIGRPVANAQGYVLDDELNVVPVGAAGELCIGGDGLARGYLRNPSATAEKFVPHPFGDTPGARLYKTGDYARHRADGAIEYLGRKDHQVKLRGFRIELGEIEARLRRHAGVKDAAVAVREDDGPSPRLVGYVVTADGEGLATQELRSHLEAGLPEYMIPSAWVFLKALPLMPNGKLDRKSLPAPAQARSDADNAYVAPRTAAEQTLADIWGEVLRAERVGVHDNFFELGGDSILGIQIVARAHQANLGLTPKDLFQYQTVAELAAVAGPAAAVRAEQGLVTGPAPLTPIQQWFFDGDPIDPHHFNQSFSLSVPPDCDPVHLREAVRLLLAHHDALRLRFRRGAGGWEQFGEGPSDDVPFLHEDLSALPEEEQRAALRAKANELQAGFDLTRAPLVRAALFGRGAHKRKWLLLIIHHLLVDGVSWRILLEDLQTCYEQLARGEEVRLPSKTTSYKEWAGRLQAYAQTEEARRELDYWEAEQRAGAGPLPVDFPGGVNLQASARTLTVSLDEAETRRLLQDVPKAYNTQINDALLTALAAAFGQWTGAPSLLLDTEGHGREGIFDDVDLSRTVGWFTAIHPVRLEVGAGTGDWGESLKRVKEHLREVPGRGVGYGLLRYLAGEEVRERLRRGARAEVSFNYLGQFDQTLSGASLFRPSGEPGGEVYSPRRLRGYLLEINGLVVGDRLQLGWTYNENIHRRETVEGLAQKFVEALRSLIEHCLSPGATGFTPSDFAEFKWSQSRLDEIMATIGKAQQ